MVLGFVSCEKEDNSNDNGTTIDTQTSLVGTTWGYNDGDATIRVLFQTSIVKVTVQSPHGDEYYEGTYTYSNGSGTIALVVDQQTRNITFTVSGSTMMAYNTPAGDVTLTLIGNPQPGPNPSGNYPLNGTTWQTSFTEYGLYITESVTFGTTNCSLNYSDSDGDTEHTTGTYTYSGTLTNGQGTITFLDDEGQPETGTFTINGNRATVTSSGESHVFTRVSK